MVASRKRIKLRAEDLSVLYGGTTALSGATLKVVENEIFAIIGPARSGKTTFLRAIHRMDEMTPGMSLCGTLEFNGKDVSNWRNLYDLRSRIGAVFPIPVGLPMSVYENVAFAARLRGVKARADLDGVVERCLTRAALWDEVKDRLESPVCILSSGQLQRLTIARALAQDPELLLLDDFSIAVDPVTTMRIEQVLKELKKEMTIVLVTNLLPQARRLADRTAFFLAGKVVEVGKSKKLFAGETKDRRTADFIGGRFG